MKRPGACCPTAFPCWSTWAACGRLSTATDDATAAAGRFARRGAARPRKWLASCCRGAPLVGEFGARWNWPLQRRTAPRVRLSAARMDFQPEASGNSACSPRPRRTICWRHATRFLLYSRGDHLPHALLTGVLAGRRGSRQPRARRAAYPAMLKARGDAPPHPSTQQ